MHTQTTGMTSPNGAKGTDAGQEKAWDALQHSFPEPHGAWLVRMYTTKWLTL